jgi:dienelactone hydrolase
MKSPFENIESRFCTPRFESTEKFTFPGIRQIFYESVPYKGKTTKVFACYGLPEGASAEKPVPAVVLVHGGGATALADWVALWNKRGYAAISMDTCGCVPAWSHNPYNAVWPQHEASGPRGWGKISAAYDAPEDQWMYHAVSAVVAGHSFLRSLPEVDSSRIGVTGISWGGVLTCIAAGLDDRFAFAMPIYGCGYLNRPDCSLNREGDPSAEQLQKWFELWDPSHYLPSVKCPMFFLAGSNDLPFPLDSLSDSIALVRNARQLVIREYPHNHTISWEEKTLYNFAGAVSAGKEAELPRFSPVALENNCLKTDFTSGETPCSAEAYYTCGSGFWTGRKWLPAPAEISGKSLCAKMPPNTTAAFFSLSLPDGSSYSSRIAEFQKM